MKMCIGVFAAALALVSPALAQDGPPPEVRVAAPAEPGAIPLYGDATPGSTASEVWSNGQPIGYMARNITRPTLTPFLPPRGKANGAAVIVAPGGAFMGLAIEHEGWRVARLLAARGYAAFVLKYRLIPTPVDAIEARAAMGRLMMKEIGAPMDGDLLRQSKAPEDGRAAVALVRAHAAHWKIDPARVGMIGFSAGAMTSRRVALDSPLAERPSFVGYIYGPQDAEAVPADAPPLFNAIAVDDNLFPSKGLAIAAAWHAAKRPVESHVYQKGGHGFGVLANGTTTTLLIDQFTAWLAMNGFANPAKK